MKGLTPRGSDASPIVSEVGFKVVIWVCLGCCIAAFLCRGGIRFACMGRLLVEDYLMLFALGLLVAISAVMLAYLDYVYIFYSVERQLASVEANFQDVMDGALLAEGLMIILTTVGVWTVKLNFMLFFRRLTRQVRIYTVLWFSALVFIMACGAASLSLVPFQCTFGGFWYVLGHCASDSAIVYEAAVTQAGVALDIVSDVVLICFPISILWRSQVNLRQKISLSAIFSLEGFTIAATIVRGSVFGSQFYASSSNLDTKRMDFVWVIFWQLMEFVVSFIVACAASFRSLWATREQKARDERYNLAQNQSGSSGLQGSQRNTKPKGWNSYYETVLESLHDGPGHSSTRGAGEAGEDLELTAAAGSPLVSRPSRTESTRALTAQAGDQLDSRGHGDEMDESDPVLTQPKPTYHHP